MERVDIGRSLQAPPAVGERSFGVEIKIARRVARFGTQPGIIAIDVDSCYYVGELRCAINNTGNVEGRIAYGVMGNEREFGAQISSETFKLRDGGWQARGQLRAVDVGQRTFDLDDILALVASLSVGSNNDLPDVGKDVERRGCSPTVSVGLAKQVDVTQIGEHLLQITIERFAGNFQDYLTDIVSACSEAYASQIDVRFVELTVETVSYGIGTQPGCAVVDRYVEFFQSSLTVGNFQGHGEIGSQVGGRECREEGSNVGQVDVAARLNARQQSGIFHEPPDGFQRVVVELRWAQRNLRVGQTENNVFGRRLRAADVEVALETGQPKAAALGECQSAEHDPEIIVGHSRQPEVGAEIVDENMIRVKPLIAAGFGENIVAQRRRADHDRVDSEVKPRRRFAGLFWRKGIDHRLNVERRADTVAAQTHVEPDKLSKIHNQSSLQNQSAEIQSRADAVGSDGSVARGVGYRYAAQGYAAERRHIDVADGNIHSQQLGQLTLSTRTDRMLHARYRQSHKKPRRHENSQHYSNNENAA